jgi:uncharacterized protein DUF5996
VAAMSKQWQPLPYEAWSATCDTLHAHTQVLGKLAAKMAPPEPQLQHAALRLSGRGWETLPLPAPNGSGAVVVALDLHRHDAVVEHSNGRTHRIPLAPNRPVGAVAREVLAVVRDLVGYVPFDPRPQETRWTTRLLDDDEHTTYDTSRVSEYFTAATQAARVLGALRAPYGGRSTPVNAWWGSFDLAVGLFSGKPADPPKTDFISRNSANAQQIEIGWWPGDARYPNAAFFAFAFPVPDGLEKAELSQPNAHWEKDLGEYVFNWVDVCVAPDPFRAALDFGVAAIRHACKVCGWDRGLAASAEGATPPVQ